MGAAAPEVLLVSAEPGATPSQCMCRLQKRFRAAEVREEQEREARLEEAQAAAKKAREYQSELEHRLQIQVCQPAAADRVVWSQRISLLQLTMSARPTSCNLASSDC